MREPSASSSLSLSLSLSLLLSSLELSDKQVYEPYMTALLGTTLGVEVAARGEPAVVRAALRAPQSSGCV